MSSDCLLHLLRNHQVVVNAKTVLKIKLLARGCFRAFPTHRQQLAPPRTRCSDVLARRYQNRHEFGTYSWRRMDENPVVVCDADVAAAFAATASLRSSAPAISTSGRFSVHNTALALQYSPLDPSIFLAFFNSL
jgi:hypothetical protein